MDAWFNQGQIAKKQLAMHGCPYGRQSESFMDIGNDTPYTPGTGCGNWSATVGIPSPLIIISTYCRSLLIACPYL
jgi:hypothetical protein